MTKEEAQKKADELNQKAIEDKGFCPLITQTCRVNCVCWFTSRVYQPQHYDRIKEYMFTQAAGCNNGMFFRECNHQY